MTRINTKRIGAVAFSALMLCSLCAMCASTGVRAETMAGTGPAAASRTQPEYADYIYAVGTNGALWQKQLKEGATWQSLGGVCTASPAAITWMTSAGTAERTDVFVRGSDGALYQKYYQNGGWSTWYSLGGTLAEGTGPAAASWGAGRIDVFVEGTDGALYQKVWNGQSWSTWYNLGGKLSASPAAVANIHSSRSETPRIIDVFVRGTDGAVWQKHWDGRAWSWLHIGGQLAPNTGPGVRDVASELYVQGTDHRLWRLDLAQPGTSWRPVASQPPQPMSASSPNAYLIGYKIRTIVSYSDTSGSIWYAIPDTSRHYSWSSVGSPPTSTSPGPASATITAPQNGAQVGGSVSASGTAKNIGSGQHLWMAVYDYNAQRYYPQQGPLTVDSDGKWQATAFFGSNGKYDIVVFVANDGANSQLLQYQQGGTNAGMTALPTGSTELAKVTITKMS